MQPNSDKPYEWIAGIDYGSKLAGTTVITLFNQADGTIHTTSSAIKQDADKLILQTIESQNGQGLIMLDAPLSLPAVYLDRFGKEQDYFYREADRVLGAMSALFLGGLMARAMKLSSQLSQKGNLVLETYPKQVVQKVLTTPFDYKQGKGPTESDIEILNQAIAPHCQSRLGTMHTWHQFDSSLCLLAGLRKTADLAIPFGNRLEGQIWI